MWTKLTGQNTDYIKEIANDQGRSVMGARQESWFYRTMRESSKRGYVLHH